MNNSNTISNLSTQLAKKDQEMQLLKEKTKEINERLTNVQSFQSSSIKQLFPWFIITLLLLTNIILIAEIKSREQVEESIRESVMLINDLPLLPIH